MTTSSSWPDCSAQQRRGSVPAEAVSLEKFYKINVNLVMSGSRPYQKYDPDKTQSSLSCFARRVSDVTSDLFGVCGMCNGKSHKKNASGRIRNAAVLTDADKLLTSQAKRNVVQFRIGSQLHVDGPEYVGSCGIGPRTTISFRLPATATQTSGSIAGLKTDPNRGHKLAPETVKNRGALLTKVGIIPSKSLRRTAPYPNLFDSRVRTIRNKGQRSRVG